MISGLGRSSGGRNDNPFQYSCLENPTDRGAWWATIHWVAKSQMQLSKKTCPNTQGVFFSLTFSYLPRTVEKCWSCADGHLKLEILGIASRACSISVSSPVTTSFCLGDTVARKLWWAQSQKHSCKQICKGCLKIPGRFQIQLDLCFYEGY